MDSPSPTNHSCLRMKLLAVIVLATSVVFVAGAVTASFISDQLSMIPKMPRTKSAQSFLRSYMETFKRMFGNRTEANNHFNHYDDQVKAEECYIDGALDFGELRMYFDRYTASHSDPQISIAYAVMNKEGTSLSAEFHVNTSTWFKLKDHFHMLIGAVNDEKLGWGVRELNMAFNC